MKKIINHYFEEEIFEMLSKYLNVYLRDNKYLKKYDIWLESIFVNHQLVDVVFKDYYKISKKQLLLDIDWDNINKDKTIFCYALNYTSEKATEFELTDEFHKIMFEVHKSLPTENFLIEKYNNILIMKNIFFKTTVILIPTVTHSSVNFYIDMNSNLYNGINLLEKNIKKC